jgi:hypothetical protein
VETFVLLEELIMSSASHLGRVRGSQKARVRHVIFRNVIFY